MKKFLTLGLLAVGCWAGAAQAAPTIATGYVAGGTNLPTGPGKNLIQTFDTLLPGTSIGTNAMVYAASMPGIAVKPLTGTLNYGAVGAGGEYDITFGPTTALSFVIGSLDTYNRLILSFSDGSKQTLSGGQITGLPFVTGSGTDTSSNGAVTYTVSGGFLTGASFFSDGGNAFEFDTIAVAVPEPAAWGMMILGFGLVGGVLRRRQSVKVKFA